jgi:hypothetical protein
MYIVSRTIEECSRGGPNEIQYEFRSSPEFVLIFGDYTSLRLRIQCARK